MLAVLLSASASAQPVKIAAPLDVRGSLLAERGGVGRGDGRDFGVPVKMFQSSTLDRFLRKAQKFLGRDDYAGAIEVLQDVLEGRVRPGDGLDELDPEADAGESTEDDGPDLNEADDPRHAVFSADDRLFRPVRRLCQEMLAGLPEAGRQLYQQMYEVAAERGYRRALSELDSRGLETTYERYFATHNGARAMYAAGDLLMHQGRFRAAIQTFRNLLQLYPIDLRDQIPDVSDAYIRVKIALCFLELGEATRAGEALAEVAQLHGGEVVSLAGEVVEVDRLADAAVFRAAAQPRAALARKTPLALRALRDDLRPIWEHRFVDTDPYRSPLASSSQRGNQGGYGGGAVPKHDQYAPGTSVCFDDAHLVFMDHFRMRVLDLSSGIMRLEGDGVTQAPPPRQGARVRVPAYDWSTLRVVVDDERYYCIIGPGRAAATGLGAVLKNEVVAYQRGTMRRLWSTNDPALRQEKRVTFLATPTLFGRRLLAPVLVEGDYGLQAMDARTGEMLYRAKLHSGGTELARATASPVAVDAGTAYVLTNAGVLGAVDAFSGDLKWVRRYERTHPLRPSRSPSRPRTNANQIRPVTLVGLVPSELAIVQGRIIFGAADGEIISCVDGASGELLWLFTKPIDRNIAVLGHNSRYLYLLGERALTCIDHRTGVRLWEKPTPTDRWSGRGLVSEELVMVPGDRAVYGMPADGSVGWQRAALPTFGIGREPLAGECNLQADGEYLVATYAGGVEVYASAAVLAELASAEEDPDRRVRLLLHAGLIEDAIEVLAPRLRDGAELDPRTRSELATRALRLARQRSLELASEGERDAALALLDRAKDWSDERALVLRWHLIRIEVFEVLADEQAMTEAQDALYAMMEGRDG